MDRKIVILILIRDFAGLKQHSQAWPAMPKKLTYIFGVTRTAMYVCSEATGMQGLHPKSLTELLVALTKKS